MKHNIALESWNVAWSDMCYLRRNLPTVVLSSLVTPLLYLVAFGYGMGEGQSVAGVPYIAYLIPGIIALSTLSSSFSSVGNKILVQRKFYSSFDELRLCPVSTASLVLGKSLLGVARGAICSIILIVLGSIVAPDFHPGPALAAALLLSCLTFSLLGVLAGLLADSMSKMNLFTSTVIIPMTFLCGTVFDTSRMPEWFQYAVNALPLTHSSSVIRATALDWAFPWGSAAALGGFALVFFVLSYYILRYRNV